MDGRHLLVQIYAHIPPAPAREALGSADAGRRCDRAAHSVAETVAHGAWTW